MSTEDPFPNYKLYERESEEDRKKHQETIDKAEAAIKGVEKYGEFINLFLKCIDKDVLSVWQQCHKEVYGY